MKGSCPTLTKNVVVEATSQLYAGSPVSSSLDWYQLSQNNRGHSRVCTSRSRDDSWGKRDSSCLRNNIHSHRSINTRKWSPHTLMQENTKPHILPQQSLQPGWCQMQHKSPARLWKLPEIHALQKHWDNTDLKTPSPHIALYMTQKPIQITKIT